MAKWKGAGIPPTRKKLHRWRTQLAEARQAEARLRREADKELEESSRRLGVDAMLVEDE